MHVRHPLLSPSLSELTPFLWIGSICLTVELALSTADFLGSPLRLQLIGLLGFWPTLLGQSYLQTMTMFVTYWLVHAGLLHLIGNLAITAWVAPRLAPHLSRASLWNIWIAAVLGGAIFFALLPQQSPSPMIGASGGVFGLIGALLVVRYRQAHRSRQTAAAIRNIALACVGLFVLSVADYLIRGSFVAWQAHLGGLIIGAVLTAIEPQKWR